MSSVGRRTGDICLRSNIIQIADGDRSAADYAWTLVPGEIVERYKPHYLSMPGAPRRQRAENGFYLPCGTCHRPKHEIDRNGCDKPHCPSALPSAGSVAAAHARHQQALEAIAAERIVIAQQGKETEAADTQPILSPEDAVAAFLAREAKEAVPPTKNEPGHGTPNGPTAGAVREQARTALIAAAERTERFSGGYCGLPEDNLVDSLTLGQARRALRDVRGGDGGELRPRAEATPPKFCAAHSSAALAVNTFAAWLGHEGTLRLANHVGFDRLAFEVTFPTGLPGNPPNLDVVASRADSLVAIESKCTEYLGSHEATFQPSYDAAVAELADDSWARIFETLQDAPNRFPRLDVGQLVRHYLGLKRAVLDGRFERATLLYAFWEPVNAADFQVFGAHRADIARFRDEVSDRAVDVVAQPYADLWAQLLGPDAPPWAGAHAAALGRRYLVRLDSL